MSRSSHPSRYRLRPFVEAALVAVLIGMAPVHVEAAGTLYWSGDFIARASTDGACHQTIRPSEINASILDVDVDSKTGKLYFIYHASIRRCDLDGGNTEVVYAPRPEQGWTPPAVFDIDRVNRKLYWTVDAGPPNRIMRSNMDGSDVEQVFSGDFPGCYGIDVDPAGGKVYWTHRGLSQGGGAIHRVNLNGTAHEQIEVPVQVPNGIVVHHAFGKVYWTANAFPNTTLAGVYRANLDFSNVEQIVSGLMELVEMDIDDGAGKLYFATQAAPEGVFRCDLNGDGLVGLGLGSAYGIACVSEELGFVCPGDANSDLLVNVEDILNVINSWGPCQSCTADVNGDGVVNVDDLLFVIGHWTI